MRVLISGATGSIGSALIQALKADGHQVTRLTRSPRSEADIGWNPSAGEIDTAGLGGHDAVSGVNYYGSRGSTLLREDSGPGSGFLSRVCQEWEQGADPAREAGIRVVHPRFGIVFPQGFALNLFGLEVRVRHPRFEIALGTGGRTLARLPVFKLTGGGWIGSGEQYWSWLVTDDVVGVILHALTTDSLQGPVNAVANPVTAREYTETLNRILNRPTVFALPAPLARMVLGEFADEMLLASIRADSTKLGGSGYEFRYPELEGALRHLLGRYQGQ
jgi:NAD dependent epimerase/dehydratase family enzyme